MKCTKTNKGITLIALIITIVVLLILAGVAISSITNDGILGYAQNAADKYNQAQKDEAQMLQNYLAFLDPCGTKGSHTWGEPVAIVEANCATKTNGTAEVTCSVCGAKETQEVFYKHNSNHYDECTECGAVCADDNERIRVPLHYTLVEANDWGHYTEDTCNHCNVYYYGEFDQAHTYENGICTACGWTCNHDEYEFTYEQGDSSGHITVGTCIYCGSVEKWTEAHSGGASYTQKDATTHIKVSSCETCGYQSADGVEEAHQWEGDNMGYGGYHTCACGLEEQHYCENPINGTGWYEEWEGEHYYKHSVEAYCDVCDAFLQDEAVQCTSWDDGKCTECGVECEHPEGAKDYPDVSSPSWNCTICGYYESY